MWDLLNGFDYGVIRWLNGFVGTNDYLDYFSWRFANNDLIKGGVLVGLLWGTWSLDRPTRDLPTDIVRTFLGMVAAIFVGRAMQLFMPHRLRPLQEPSIGFKPPDNMPANVLDGWSSFPSDHAVLYTAIAVALFWRSRFFGLLGLAWAVFAVFVPRLYVGVHYPSDIIVGSLLGACLMAIAMTMPSPKMVSVGIRRFHRTYPAPFQFFAFLAAFEAASQFRGSRFFVSSLGYFFGMEL